MLIDCLLLSKRIDFGMCVVVMLWLDVINRRWFMLIANATIDRQFYCTLIQMAY